MDRNREGRRLSAMTASTNGVSRRRHRTSSLRDSPEEAPAETIEPGRLRDRGVKKEIDRDRGRVRLSKRRKNDEESSEGSVSDDVGDEDEDGGTVRMVPPHPAVTNHGHSQHAQKHLSKEFKPVQRWKPADEVIGFSVPRKARSASTKRSHENWISGGGAAAEQNHRKISTQLPPSPAPLSPSSSNVSVIKKVKPNGGSKQKPPKSSSKASSSNPEELEIEIAEVLYGLMTHKEADSPAKFDPNLPNESTAPLLAQNSGSLTVPFSAIAPKRKKPRQVPENPSNGEISSTVKSEINQPPKIETLLSNPVENPIANSENGNSKFQTLSFEKLETPGKELPARPRSLASDMPDVKPVDHNSDMAVTKMNSTSSEMDIEREEKFEIDLMAPASPEREKDIDFSAKPVESQTAEIEIRKMMVTQDTDEKASKSGRDEIPVEEPVLKKAKSVSESGESEKVTVIKERQLVLEAPDRGNNAENSSGDSKSHSHVEKQQQPRLDVAKDHHPRTERAAQSYSLPMPMPMSLATWPGGLPPMGYMAPPLQGVASMDGSQFPPTAVQPMFSQPRPKRCATHCYIARNIQYLQQFMKMNPFWPSAAPGSASLFGAKPCNLNVVPATELHGRAISSVQDNGQGLAIFPGQVGKEMVSQPSTSADAQGKQQHVFVQQPLPPGAPLSNMLHGPAFIFPFNQQQAAMAAAAAAASVRPGTGKPPNAAPNSAASASASVNGSSAAPPTPAAMNFSYPNMPSNDTQYLTFLQNNGFPFPIPAPTSASVNGSSAAPPTPPAAMSFSYPNMPSNDTQYLTFLQNNAFPFPIPAPTYRGTHPQAMPLFNGSFYASQMIHPSHLQQQQQIQPGQLNASISNGSSSSQKQHLQSQQQTSQATGNLNAFPEPKTRPAQSPQPHQARIIETAVGNEYSSSTADSQSSRGPLNVYGQNQSMPIHQQSFALVSSTQASGTGNGNNTQGESQKLQQSQHQSLKAGAAESLPPTYTVSFASMNGGTTAPGGIDLSSVAQNHAVFQNLSEANRRNYQVTQAAAVAKTAQQRSFRVSEEGRNGVVAKSSNIENGKKGVAPKASATRGQSIAFTQPDLTDPSISPHAGINVVDSSARKLILPSSANNLLGSQSSMSNIPQLGQIQNVQFQQRHIQQQMVQIQKQRQQLQEQFAAARNNKTPPTSNGGVYGDHLATSPPSSASKFPISGFPQHLVQSGSNNSSSPPPQWKNSTRTGSQVQSSSQKNLPQQQQARLQQSHAQISFGSGEKLQQPLSSHQSSPPPIGVGSPTSSLSKGAGGSPRTSSSNSQGNKSFSLSQQSKNPASQPSLKTTSILGNPHNVASSNNSTKPLVQQQQQQQLQLKQMANQQPQLFFSPAYMQTQPPQSTSNSSNTTSGIYLQRRYPEKQPQQEQQGGYSSGSSTGLLALCTPVTLASSSTAEAKAGTGSASNSTKGPSQSILHHLQFQAQPSGSFSYTHTGPSGVQVKPTTEQKQPAGNREALARK